MYGVLLRLRGKRDFVFKYKGRKSGIQIGVLRKTGISIKEDVGAYRMLYILYLYTVCRTPIYLILYIPIYRIPDTYSIYRIPYTNIPYIVHHVTKYSIPCMECHIWYTIYAICYSVYVIPYMVYYIWYAIYGKVNHILYTIYAMPYMVYRIWCLFVWGALNPRPRITSRVRHSSIYFGPRSDTECSAFQSFLRRNVYIEEYVQHSSSKQQITLFYCKNHTCLRAE